MHTFTTTPTLDHLTAQHTAFPTFIEFVDAGYTPTILLRRARSKKERAQLAQLADAFDEVMQFRDSPIRVFRGRIETVRTVRA